MTPQDELLALVNGYRISAALTVAADLGLSDLLAEGPRSAADLAAALDADEDTLRRLLHALATVRVYAEQEDGSFGSTPIGEGLRSDVTGSVRPLARTMTDPAMWAAWGHLGHSVRTGDNAFPALHGVDVWTHRRSEPHHNAIFNETMTAIASRVAGAVADAVDLSGYSTAVDVGGGQGTMLAGLLRRNEHLTGTVLDLAHVLPEAAPDPALAARWSVSAGSFFEEIPSADVLLLKSVLHDWPDDECTSLLRACRRALHPDGLVLVVERVLGRTGHEVESAFSDLNMLVMPGGRERTEAEYAALLDLADLRLTRVVDTGTPFAVVEAVARP